MILINKWESKGLRYTSEWIRKTTQLLTCKKRWRRKESSFEEHVEWRASWWVQTVGVEQIKKVRARQPFVWFTWRV